ncbi:putative signal transducing protein [Parabacteroides sp. Marseille-P3160]|uniref:putative signal transducing protein n=1 Tax=Parabacteroides sp. Marseille-P3160 TaxID=1917887 RepID=UPI0009BB1591|nr:DUF2007 domain-containing protein [Parabacteroides sp. Marseille-P3160]
MDRMVEIARFQYLSEAQTLVSYLKSEGIDCYVRNEASSQVLAGYVGMELVRVETLESNVPHALETMKAGGYEVPDEGEYSEEIKTVVGWAKHIPFLRRFSLEKQIIILFIIIAILLVILILVSSYLTKR